MKIIKLSPAERKIGLSIRALKSDEFRADWEAYTETTGTAGATLGDHFKHQQLRRRRAAAGRRLHGCSAARRGRS